MQVAESKGLPKLKHHLLPRTKGFWVTVQNLRGTGEFAWTGRRQLLRKGKAFANQMSRSVTCRLVLRLVQPLPCTTPRWTSETRKRRPCWGFSTGRNIMPTYMWGTHGSPSASVATSHFPFCWGNQSSSERSDFPPAGESRWSRSQKTKPSVLPGCTSSTRKRSERVDVFIALSPPTRPRGLNSSHHSVAFTACNRRPALSLVVNIYRSWRDGPWGVFQWSGVSLL